MSGSFFLCCLKSLQIKQHNFLILIQNYSVPKRHISKKSLIQTSLKLRRTRKECLHFIFCANEVAELTGLEPATFRVTGERSNQTELQLPPKTWLLGLDSNQ